MTLLPALCVMAIVLIVSAPTRTHRVHGALRIGLPPSPLSRVRDLPRRIPGSRWARAAAQRNTARVIDAMASLVAELHVGAPARVALARAFADVADVCPRTVAAARFGGDVGEALRGDGERVSVLLGLAAVWQVAEDSGAGLATACSALLNGLRESQELRRTLDTQLAGPRASARMLSALPIVGLLMGLMLGGNPLAWLLTTTPGRLCLLGGVVLNILGAVWTRRIAAKAAATA